MKHAILFKSRGVWKCVHIYDIPLTEATKRALSKIRYLEEFVHLVENTYAVPALLYPDHGGQEGLSYWARKVNGVPLAPFGDALPVQRTRGTRADAINRCHYDFLEIFEDGKWSTLNLSRKKV